MEELRLYINQHVYYQNENLGTLRYYRTLDNGPHDHIQFYITNGLGDYNHFGIFQVGDYRFIAKAIAVKSGWRLDNIVSCA